MLLTESIKIRKHWFYSKFFFNWFTYFSISGKFVLVWQRGDDVLTAQSIMVSPDKRYKLLPDHTLEIRKITPNDGGDYSCKISVLGEPIEIRHTLEILRKSFSYFAGFLFFFCTLAWYWKQNIGKCGEFFIILQATKEGKPLFRISTCLRSILSSRFQFLDFGPSDQCAKMPIIITCIPYIT